MQQNIFITASLLQAYAAKLIQPGHGLLPITAPILLLATLCDMHNLLHGRLPYSVKRKLCLQHACLTHARVLTSSDCKLHMYCLQPNFYPNVKGMSTRQWLGCCFVNDFGIFAYNLSCPSWRTCEYEQMAGPAWGHVSMYPQTLDWLLK